MASTSSLKAAAVCDIVIPIWNQPELTKRCLKSVAENTEEPVRLIVVDNGSEAPTRTQLEEFAKGSPLPVLLIRNEENLGFIRATNQGIRSGEAPWVCLLNNDTVVTPRWLTEMLKVATENPTLGLLNPTSNSLGFQVGGVPLRDYAASLQKETGRWELLPKGIGFCLLARRALLEEVGLLDESYGMGNFDDDELSRCVRSKGYLCARVCASYVFHEEKASFREIPGWEKAFDANRRTFEARWGRGLRILCDLLPHKVALELLDQDHWLYLLCAREELPQELSSRAQVSCLGAKGNMRFLSATLRALSKRKKPYDLIVSNNPAWSRWLKIFKWAIPGEILHHPSQEEFLQRCRILSQSRSRSAPEEARPLPAATALPLSVVVITKNEAKRLADCLETVRWAGEIIVVDDASTDETLAVAHRYTDRVIQRTMEIEGTHRNFAHDQARFEWIFSLDADERVTPELAQEIRDLFSGNPACDIYSVPRRNHIGTRWIRHGGWYPSAQVKLFRRSMFRWEETTVHPRALTSSTKPWGALKSDLIHLSYRDLSDFTAKLNRQTTLEAAKWVQDGRRMTLGKALWRSLDRLCRSFFMKKGFRDGFIGLFCAVAGGFYQFLSYAKYWHLKNTPSLRGAEQRSNLSDGETGLLPPDLSGGRNDMKLSVVILTKNAMATFPACLDSVRWADEIIVVDGGSTDGTMERAQRSGAQVIHEAKGDDFAALRNLGADSAAGDWVLQLDADEVVTAEFRKTLEEILSKGSPQAAYKFRRRNTFLGHRMRFGGWDHHSLHLFRKGKARYEGRVHERLMVQGEIGTLDAGVEHFPFRSLEEFIDRQNRYTTLEARDLLEVKGGFPMRTVWWKTTGKPLKLFWKTFVKKQAFREGRIGLIFSGLYAFVHFLKWAKVWEIQDAQSRHQNPA